MKKLLVPLLLCVATIGTASAAWKKVTYSDAADFYIEPSTIRSNGNYKEAWVLTDLKSAQKSPDGSMYLSTKVKYRFDCAGDKTNFLAIVYYSGNMGEGDVMFNKSFNDNDWSHNIPGSVSASYTRAVCGK